MAPGLGSEYLLPSCLIIHEYSCMFMLYNIWLFLQYRKNPITIYDYKNKSYIYDFLKKYSF